MLVLAQPYKVIPSSSCNQVSGEGSGSAGVAQMPPERKHMSSIVGASFNFINSIIGSGIIGRDGR